MKSREKNEKNKKIKLPEVKRKNALQTQRKKNSQELIEKNSTS